MCSWRRQAAALLVALVATMTAFAAPAALKDENLLIKLPDSFHVGSSNSAGGMDMMELVTAGETVDNWTELVTVQTMHEHGEWPAQAFLSALLDQMTAACPTASRGVMEPVVRNGYQGAITSFRCPLNPATAKPENVDFIAVQGADSFYLVQTAFRRTPTMKDRQITAALFASVGVCDSRKTDHPCPDLAARGFTQQ